MADLYGSYGALAAAETEGVAYERRTVPVTGATWCAIAIHGGGIEGGSGEAARAVAAGLMAHYEFAGIKSSGNSDLHVTSTNFDEPICEGIVHSARRCLSFHGFSGTTGVAETAIGGLDTATVARVTANLQAAGFAVGAAPSEIAGDNPTNICNETTIGAGVQLELSRAQREAFFPNGDLTRAMRDSGQRTAAFTRYVNAVRAAFQGSGVISLGSINVSRYTLLPAQLVDANVTARVATDKLATGGSHFMALVARYRDGANMYLARLEFSTSQAVILTLRKRVGGTETLLAQFTTGLTHAAGRAFRVRFQVAGVFLRARAWQDGTAEPAVWQLEVADGDLTSAGQVGMRSILSSANTNVLPVVATWDAFDNSADGLQTFTVQRSVNGVTKPHAAGAPLSLAYPAIASL